MAVTRQAGPGIGLDLRPLSGNQNFRSLAAGSIDILPAGQFWVTPGPYSCIQTLDPITGLWRTLQTFPNANTFVNSDGANVRLANLTGCAVGAFVTNVGSGYTSAPAVAVSAGGSAFTAIVGGAINATVTVTTAGAGYTNAPRLIFSAPPAGGIPASGIAVVSAGAISSVTVVNQGAGYVTAPTITVVADPRDTITTPAALTVNATLAGAGTITAVVCTNPGQPVTAVPTLTFSGGGGASAAATVVMCFTATGFTVSNAGVAYGNAQPFGVITTGGVVAGTAGATINPQFGPSLFTPRQANISGTTTAGSVITATGSVVNDGGLFQAVPTGLVIPSGTAALPTTTAIVAITVGGVTDTAYIQPF